MKMVAGVEESEVGCLVGMGRMDGRWICVSNMLMKYGQKVVDMKRAFRFLKLRVDMDLNTHFKSLNLFGLFVCYFIIF